MMKEKLLDEAYRLLQTRPKEKQIKKITRLYKYVLKWKGRQSIFLYIVKAYPELRGKIPVKLQNSYNLSALYAAMTKAQLSNIIKRLEAIERRNKQRPSGMRFNTERNW